MHNFLTTSIVLYGDINNKDSSKWREFYYSSRELMQMIEVKANYVGISGESFKSKKVLDIQRVQKKIIKALDNSSEIDSFALYSLPEGFTTAVFDYDCYICRTSSTMPSHILITFSNELFKNVDLEKIVSKFKGYINFQSGQVFQLSNLESPQIYALQTNSLNTFKSLKIIKEIN
ncbi:hypothetical protein [Paenibacillus kandeliae]|uniref:hypothetical protein n=1 Tax=Paenibacillus kandeliae TaxID=3231269 RepID=UPI003457D0C4